MFIERLKKIRNERGISQAKLAEALNISQQAVAKWETGGSSPDPAMLSTLADYFNISLDWLLGRTNRLSPVPQIPQIKVTEEISGEQLKVLEKVDLLYLAKYVYMYKQLPYESRERVLMTIIYEYERNVLGVSGIQILKKVRGKDAAG